MKKVQLIQFGFCLECMVTNARSDHMPETIKDHTTVTITVEMLDELRPCAYGRAGALPFLPAVFSTDPHDNLKLAEKWTRSDRAQAGRFDLWWLVKVFCAGPGDNALPDSEDFNTGACYRSDAVTRDAWVAAQYMAMIADVIATREGR